MPCKASGIPLYQGRHGSASPVKTLPRGNSVGKSPVVTYGKGQEIKKRGSEKKASGHWEGTDGDPRARPHPPRGGESRLSGGALRLPEDKGPIKRTPSLNDAKNTPKGNPKERPARLASPRRKRDSSGPDRREPTPDPQQARTPKRDPLAKSPSHLKPPASPSLRRANLPCTPSAPPSKSTSAPFGRNGSFRRSSTSSPSKERKENPCQSPSKAPAKRNGPRPEIKATSPLHKSEVISAPKSRASPNGLINKGAGSSLCINKRRSESPFSERGYLPQQSTSLKTYNSNPLLPTRNENSKPQFTHSAKMLGGSETKISGRQSADASSVSSSNSSLVNPARSRARIVTRVMTSSVSGKSVNGNKLNNQSPLPKRRTVSNISFNSKISPLGSRNNIYRSSLDSHKAESTTDSGCNSPSYGSQSSLNNDGMGTASPHIARRIAKRSKSDEKKSAALTLAGENARNKMMKNDKKKGRRVENAENERIGIRRAKKENGELKGKMMIINKAKSQDSKLLEEQNSSPREEDPLSNKETSRRSIQGGDSSERSLELPLKRFITDKNRDRRASTEDQRLESLEDSHLSPNIPENETNGDEGRRTDQIIETKEEEKARLETETNVNETSCENEVSLVLNPENQTRNGFSNPENNINIHSTEERVSLQRETEFDAIDHNNEINSRANGSRMHSSRDCMSDSAFQDDVATSEWTRSEGHERADGSTRMADYHPPDQGEDVQSPAGVQGPEPDPWDESASGVGGSGRKVSLKVKSANVSSVTINKSLDHSNLSHIIDSTLIDNLKLNGNILNNQFDAIITTLKKVAESMDMSQQSAPNRPHQGSTPRKTSYDETKQPHRNNTFNDYLNKNYSRSISAPPFNGAPQQGPFSPISYTRNNKCIIELPDNTHPHTPSSPDCSSIIQIGEGGDRTPSEASFKINGMAIPEEEGPPSFLEPRRPTKALSKSRELLHHLEAEYKQLKGADFGGGSKTPLEVEVRSLERHFDKLFLSIQDDAPPKVGDKGSPPKGEGWGGKIRKEPQQKKRNGAINGLFPFLQKRNRGQSSARRVTYKDLTLNQMGVPPLQHDDPPAPRPTPPPDEGDPEAQPRSLSLPKSFLSDKYGISGFKSALPSVAFPWRRDEPGGTSVPSEDLCDSRGPTGDGVNGGTSAKASQGKLSNGNSSPFPCEKEAVENSSYSRPTGVSRSEWDIHRPWSYSEDGHAPSLSQSACRLSLEGQQPLDTHDQHRIDALSMPYSNGTENQNIPEGKFQKFRKTLSLRLAKRGSRAESPSRGGSKPPLLQTPPIVGGERNSHDDVMRDDDLKSTYFKFGHPLFRTSKERKRAKLRDSRSSKCNSGDSGDSGIELASGTSTLMSDVALSQTNDDVIFGSDFHGNGDLAEESSLEPCDVTKQKVLRRTRSDMSKSRSPQRHLLGTDPHHRQSLGRQYSSPQPIKVRPFHRLPDYSMEPCQRNSRLKRSKGSTHLRRSVSQPLDLDKSFQAQVSLQKMRIPPDEESSVQRQRRRPSVGNLLSEENSSEEDGGLSDGDEFKQGFKRCLEEEDELIVFAEALWDHVSLDSDELVFKAGDLITVVDSSDKDWWWGRITHRSGWFPASFVRLLVNQEDHQGEGPSSLEPGADDWSSRKLSFSSLSQDQVRCNVINEILSTERDYVKHLRDVVEGYLRQVRKRPDMFSSETIATIFGNMEALFNFHSQFLRELEQHIDYENPHRSCIGECFIRNKSRFEIYSEYCNNHPSAVSELQELYQDQKFVHFFEACRLLQEMIDISIDGFLLTPVQKICKYPLQLQELLKYTKPNHGDYATVHGAMQAMKEVALLVNERRRRMECLEKIASWQKGVEGWEGRDLLDDSSQLIHQGEVTKGVGGSWPKEVTLFLFDHQLVYCKRDLLKRNTYVYRGRVNTDLCEVIDIPDDPMRSAAFHHAWKIHCLHKSKTYVFTSKTALEKSKWLHAFKRERALVAMDEASGFVASEKQKQVARMAARNQRTRPKKPRMKTHARKQVMTYAQAQLLVNTDTADENRSNSLPPRGQQPPHESKKKGHWFMFGGHKKSRSASRTQKHNSFHNS